MCGRYTLTWPLAAILKDLGATPVAGTVWAPSYNIAPGSKVLTIVERSGTLYAGLMEWGMLPRPGSAGRRIINARRDSLLEKPFFRQAVQTGRAIVPADGYFEWTRDTRDPYRLCDPKRNLWYFAAVFQVGPDHSPRLALVTTEAVGPVAAVHPRMPYILPRVAIRSWLDASHGAYRALITLPAPVSEAECYPVSRAVNRADADGPHLIQPLPRTPSPSE